MSIRIPVTPDVLNRARVLEAKIPKGISNSIKSGDGRLGGCIAEICLADYFRSCGLQVSSNEEKTSYTHDIEVSSLRLEIKCTERTFFVRDDWNVHVAKSQYNNQKRCDWFAFASLKYAQKQKRSGAGYIYLDPQVLEVVGYYQAAKVYTDFDFRRKGECGKDFKPAVWDEYYMPINRLAQKLL